jgi:hypothetical protein
MSTVRRSTRKRSALAAARSQQVVEMLTFNENSQEAQREQKLARTEAKEDKDYALRVGTAEDIDLEERERKDSPRHASRPRKRRSSAQNSASEASAADSDSKNDGKDAETGEPGPMSERFRLLPAGTHTAVSYHARGLFAQAVAAENDAKRADNGNAAQPLSVDPDAETDDEKEDPLSSRSASSTSSSTESASSSSSEACLSSQSRPEDEHSPAGVDEESTEHEQHAHSQPERSSPVQFDVDSPGLLPEHEHESPLSPLLLEFAPERLRGLSRSPEPLRLPEVQPAAACPRSPRPLSLSRHSMDAKHGQLSMLFVLHNRVVVDLVGVCRPRVRLYECRGAI